MRIRSLLRLRELLRERGASLDGLCTHSQSCSQQRWRTQPACADDLTPPRNFGQAVGATHPWVRCSGSCAIAIVCNAVPHLQLNTFDSGNLKRKSSQHEPVGHVNLQTTTKCMLSNPLSCPHMNGEENHPNSSLTHHVCKARAILQALGTDEVAPGITFSELSSRRDALASLLPTGAVCVLPSAPQQFRVGAIPHPYRQNSDFLYLTGLQQEGVAVFHKVSESRLHYTLLKTAQPSSREIWDGPVMCLDVVTGVFGADEAHPLSEGSLRTCLEQRLAHSTAQNILYMDRDRTCTELAYALRHVIADPAPRRQGGWSTTDAVGETSGGARCLQVQPLRPLLHHLRWRKSDAEIAAMRRSVATGAAAVRACIAATQPGIGEHALAALYEFHVKAKGGATALAFPPVVGGGANACTVHYRHADSLLQDGEVVLMDAGAEVWGACSDVSRSWPVNGRFSPAQRVVYEHVAEVHRACVARCLAGDTLADVHALSVRMLQRALVDLGVHLQPHEYRQVYPHSVGHWLGWDTHDVDSVGQVTQLQPGVVLTIEPGLYLPANHPGVPREFANIGVRIEDDVLVTADGPEVLSDHESLPIDVERLEALVGTNKGAIDMMLAAC